MKSILSILLPLNLIWSVNVSADKESRPWFQHANCTKLKIVKQKSAADQTVVKSVEIEDVDYVRSLQTAIRQLPTSGTLMIKMSGEAPYTMLEFSCGDQTDVIEFYSGMVKTPATSFYDSQEPAADALWAEVESHLAPPKLGQVIPKVKGRAVTFAPFTITYMGHADRTPQQSSATLNVETFKVQAKGEKAAQTLEVRSGQLPPTDVEFKVGPETYVLSTFRTPDGQDLLPRQMLIRKK